MGSLLVTRNNGGMHAYDIVDPPVGAAPLFREVVGASDLSCMPRLLWLADAGNAGGFAMPGLVAIGANDLRAMVDAAWRRYVRPVDANAVDLYRWINPNAHLITRADLWRAFAAFTMAHELGHIRQMTLGIRQPTIVLEADADRFAGSLAEKFGWDARLGQIVAHSIGCRDELCDHPSPEWRVAHYNMGRAERRSLERAELAQTISW